MHILETGTPGAPAVVFLHGLIISGWMWQQQAQLLNQYHCLIPDLPAHGLSQQLPWVSIENTGQQVAQLIRERATHGQAHLVGLSLGSLIALQVMHHAPEIVSKVIISGTNLRPLPIRMQASNLVLLPFLKTEWFVRIASRGLRLTPEATGFYRQSVQAMSLRTVLKVTQQAAAFQLPANLHSTAIPVVVVAGELENRLIHQSMELLLATLPKSKGFLAPGGRHGWVGEKPDLFGQMAHAWFCDSPLPKELVPVQVRNEAS